MASAVVFGCSRPLVAALATSSSSSSASSTSSALFGLQRSVSQALTIDDRTPFRSNLTHSTTPSSPPTSSSSPSASVTVSQALSLWIHAALFPFPVRFNPDSSPPHATESSHPPRSRAHPLEEEDQPSAIASLSAGLLDLLPDFGILFAVPKNKPSKQRGKTRRVGFMLNRGIPLKRYRICPNCGQENLLNHICFNCFLNNKQLTRITGWKNKSVFPWKDKVSIKPEEDHREWTAPQGVPDNRAWIATEAELLYKKERAGEKKRKKKHPSTMRREVLRFRERDEARRRLENVNQQLLDDRREIDEERAKYEQSIKEFDELWAQKRLEKRQEIESTMRLNQQKQSQSQSQSSSQQS